MMASELASLSSNFRIATAGGCLAHDIRTSEHQARIHGGFSVESGFKLGAFWPRSRDLTIRLLVERFFFFFRIQRESIVIVKKLELEILTNLHVLDLPESEKHNCGIMSVCL
ncbi:hypothetical protein AVEN_243040-1 [Araneus ventricosus]|uniref:Uncharacterized protein n=1 Tax=Araneus ventricosus TaxID=182803 RepID=A0A4Y2PTY6_ARAVE|nr:hypothetical protein AVEN_243040-1 [Araneus ventricosus]